MLNKREAKLAELKEYGEENNVPIVQDEGLEILLQTLEDVKPKRVLEIGTAIGYSALQMSQVISGVIVTFEREEKMIEKARENFRELDEGDQILLITEDFLKKDITDLGEFDFVYVDGAKAQYYNFFKHFENSLSDNAVILFDNLDFHGYVNNEEKKTTLGRGTRQLVRKIEKFLEVIEVEPGYQFEHIKKGDGIGILRKEQIDKNSSNSK